MPTTKSTQRRTPTSKRSGSSRSAAPDAITLLKDDHRAVKRLFREFEQAGDRAHKTRRRLVDEMIVDLSRHAAIEETVFYPWVRDHADDLDDEVLESLEEHHVVKWLLWELEDLDPTAERFVAKVTVMAENVRHHIEEEESDLFPQVREAASRSDLRDLGALLAEAKKRAPTRPHPRSPDEPPANLVTAPVASALDHAREIGREAVERIAGGPGDR